jgi:uncharacterized membrane protein
MVLRIGGLRGHIVMAILIVHCGPLRGVEGCRLAVVARDVGICLRGAVEQQVVGVVVDTLLSKLPQFMRFGMMLEVMVVVVVVVGIAGCLLYLRFQKG